MSGLIINPYAFATGGGGIEQDPYWGVATQTGGSTLPGASWYGWRFTVGAEALYVNAFRVYMNHSDDELVRLWRVSTSSIVTSGTVTASAGSWASGSITPVEMVADEDYIVVTKRTNDASRSIYRNFTTRTFFAGLTYVSDNTTSVGDDTLPTGTSSNEYTCVDLGFVE